MTKQKQPKPKKKTPASLRQHFDPVEAKRSMLAQFDIGLNNYQRGPDNKWQKTLKP